jgi:hypothetical protein
MIVAMLESATDDQIQNVTDHLVNLGFAVHRTTGERQSILAAVGAIAGFDIREVELLPGVQQVHRISSPYKLAGRSFRPDGTVVKLPKGVEVGSNAVVVRRGHVRSNLANRLCSPPSKSLKPERKCFGAGLSNRAPHLTPFREWDSTG